MADERADELRKKSMEPITKLDYGIMGLSCTRRDHGIISYVLLVL